LEPDLWAGTKPETPAVLEGWEVERVMQLLHSSDSLIRKKVRDLPSIRGRINCRITQTLRILQRVDANIVESYYLQSLKGIPPGLSLKDRNEHVTRLLEVTEVISGEDGEAFAKQLKDVFHVVESDATKTNQSVLESAVEMVLMDTRHGVS
jgi:AP-4 complex subunit epsilon-1